MNSLLYAEGHLFSHQKVRKAILNIFLTLLFQKKVSISEDFAIFYVELLRYSIHISSDIYHDFFFFGGGGYINFSKWQKQVSQH